jgi:hypothetical protein
MKWTNDDISALLTELRPAYFAAKRGDRRNLVTRAVQNVHALCVQSAIDVPDDLERVFELLTCALTCL